LARCAIRRRGKTCRTDAASLAPEPPDPSPRPQCVFPGVAARHDPDATPGIGIAQRVLQQVAKRLVSRSPSANALAGAQIRLHAEPALIEPLAQGFHRLLQELRDLDALLAVGKRADVASASW